MRSYGQSNKSGARVAFRAWARALTLGALLSLSFGASTVSAAPTVGSPATTTHVYLLRGVLNVFSLGLDQIAAQLESQGIPVTVANFVSWSSLADEAAAAYRAGRLKTIVLVGHSSGATALPDMIAKLHQEGVPVKLAIGLDSVFKTRLSTGADRYINFYIGNGNGEPVRAAGDLRGKLDNVDVQSMGIGHISIDKNEIMQRKVIGAIDSVVFGGHPRGVAAPASKRAKPVASAVGSGN